MKKILSLLSTVSLSTIISTNIIACQQQNTNNQNNKPKKPIEPEFTPQKPSENSNWKLVNGFVNEKNNENKNYIGIIKIESDWKIIKWIGKKIDYKYQYKNIYRWDGVDEPTTPTINNNTGEITNWNEKIELF